jgi:hypothetical protein
MTCACCMTSTCALADADKHLLNRTSADFSEELIRQPDNTASCPFFIDKKDIAIGTLRNIYRQAGWEWR